MRKWGFDVVISTFVGETCCDYLHVMLKAKFPIFEKISGSQINSGLKICAVLSNVKSRTMNN